MANTYAGGIYVVAATKDAAFAVKEMLPPGWACTVTDRHLTPDQVAELNLRANGVRKLKSLP
jgi:hypothetical protein